MDKKDEKLSKESFAAYRAWQKYLRKAHPKLSKGLVKSTLVMYCLVMASDGANGIGCFTSDATIAEDCELYDYRSVAPYRREALRLGWFVWTGEKRGRKQVLNIAIPEVEESAAQANHVRSRKVAEDTEVGTEVISSEVQHDTSTAPGYCAACRPYFAQVSNGEMTTQRLFEIHEGD